VKNVEFTWFKRGIFLLNFDFKRLAGWREEAGMRITKRVWEERFNREDEFFVRAKMRFDSLFQVIGNFCW